MQYVAAQLITLSFNTCECQQQRMLFYREQADIDNLDKTLGSKVAKHPSVCVSNTSDTPISPQFSLPFTYITYRLMA
jgi:hypothetical protein